MHAPVLAQSSDAAAAGIIIVAVVIGLAILGFMIATFWKIFEKAGEDGWKAIIPIYNQVVILQIIGRPMWWIAFFVAQLVPILNLIAWIPALVFSVIMMIDLAKSFGKDTGFGVGLAFLPFVFGPILAFGDARYLGPAGPEPRPGYANLGGGGYGQQGFAAGGYQPPQQWGQPDPYGQQPQQWGQQPDAYGQPQAPQWGQPAQPDQPGQQGGWGQAPAQPQQDWGQPAQPDQPGQQGGWGQPPAQPQQGWGQPSQPEQGGWGQSDQQGDDQGYPPPPVS
ncbi:DUF5684 domain-containing protein [Euzebya rosea]|uniref:DUF5684 domain-containing protein n=1 Tax=Euzebya rosea TaxID=2052804 RepID=UPI00196AD264|nr:DUF5684 domain-containing protein [Euzebya rosea]